MPDKKELLQIIVVKTLLAVVIFAGVGTIIIGGGLLVGKRSKISEPVEPSQKKVVEVIEKEDTSEWNIYNNPEVDFTFKYPEDWEIIADYFYETAAGSRADAPTVILRKIGNENVNNEIAINARQYSCEEEIGKCVDLHNVYIGTHSKDQEILETFDQILSTFKFIEKEGGMDWLPLNSLYFLSLVSSDNQKVVWTENKFRENKMNSKLMLADLDGQNKKTLLEKNLDGEKYFNPVRWSNSNEEIYFSEQHGGLGGYIIFSGPSNLSKINIYTGKSECLFEESNRISHIGDISPNEEFIAYFPRIDGNPKLVIKNMKTGKENMVDIPINEGFKNGGNTHFSPDNKHIVYNIAHGDPDNEYYRTIIVNSFGKNQRVIIDNSQKIYIATGWISNNEILLRDHNNTDYVIDIDGRNLRKK
ncbi:MAG: hypothetical protein U9P70_00970 [Patescibacteria group bacterium]|nr:hypothetical protein [Patescibacteria group bacterium]